MKPGGDIDCLDSDPNPKQVIKCLPISRDVEIMITRFSYFNYACLGDPHCCDD